MAATADQWPDIAAAYGWVQCAATLLANADGQAAADLRTMYTALTAALGADPQAWGRLADAQAHFLKVTASYAPGLFACYDHAHLPRTNNDLEHVFGRARYHERRTNGRKQATPALVVRGAVRVVTILATRTQPLGVTDLVPVDRARWQALRHQLDHRHAARRAQYRFRKDHHTYLTNLENALLKLPLPS